MQPMKSMRSKDTEKVLKILELRGMDDDEHINYALEECAQMDMMNAWADIKEIALSGRKTNNRFNMLLSYLLGISEFDPLKRRTFIQDENGIEDPCRKLIFKDRTESSIHQDAWIADENDNPIEVTKLAPGMMVPKKIFAIFPGTSKFRAIQTDDDIELDNGIVLIPRKGKHVWKETNEPPDIDVDFSPRSLDDIVKWCSDHYGSERVVGVVTYQRFSFKTALRDVCRLAGLAPFIADQIVLDLPEDANKLRYGDKDFDDRFEQIVSENETLSEWSNHPKYKRIIDFIRKSYGRVRTYGTHASAMIISKDSLEGNLPIITREGKRMSQWAEGQNKTELSVFGYVKFDRLGLQAIDDLHRCVELCYERKKLDPEAGIFRHPIMGDWGCYEYLENPEVLSAASRGETVGVFQFESAGLQAMLRDMKADSFNDLAAANAMYRPAILKAKVDGIDGGQIAYAKRKRGEVSYELPEVLKPVMSYTYGLPIYQEQIMKILNIVGGIPLNQCNAARSAIAKKKIDKLKKFGEMFSRNAPSAIGWSKEKAQQYFDDMIVSWSGYGFNKCIDPHSQVLCENGMIKNAEDCVSGDRIQAYDVDAKTFFYDDVVELHKNGVKEVFEVELSDRKIIRCTMDHELLCSDGVKRRLEDVTKEGFKIVVDAKVRLDNPSTASIVSVHSLGQKRVIDLEMKSKGHNFVANGVVVGNSHSVAYAMLAARTLYLKTHFQIEFYVTFMASLKRSKMDYARIKLFVSDASKSGIEVLGTDVNASSFTYTIAKDPKDPEKEVIRFGLSQVKNVGKAATEIVENQPYRDFEDYLNRGPNNKGVVVSLILAGAFDTIHSNKGHLLTFFDDWRKSLKKGVGVKRFKAFAKAIGMSKDDTNRYQSEFKEALQNVNWIEDEEDNDNQDEVDEDRSNIQEYEDESIPIPDADLIDVKEKNVVEKKVSNRSQMPKKEFRLWVKTKFSEYFDWREIIKPALEDSIGDLHEPSMDDYKAWDIIREIQCEGGNQVYGCQLPFMHPLRWKKGKVHWIRDYGKDVIWHHKLDGEKFRRQQNTIDGIVESVQNRVSQNGNKYWRVVIDDGYDRVSISIWKKVWELTGVEGVLIYDEKGRPIKIGHNNGSPVWKKKEIPKPKDIIKEGALVRLKVKNPSKWGFNLDYYCNTDFVEDQSEPAIPLKMRVSWDKDAYQDAKRSNLVTMSL